MDATSSDQISIPKSKFKKLFRQLYIMSFTAMVLMVLINEFTAYTMSSIPYCWGAIVTLLIVQRSIVSMAS